MTDEMVIPDEAVKYILFQRTAYLLFPVAAIYRPLNALLPFETPIYNLVIAIESRLRAARIKALYDADMNKEYRSIRNVLPKKCSSVLDIGSGVAGIDVLIHRHYCDPSVDFYLLDKNRVERNVFYMFRPKGAFYNSLDVASAFLTANGLPPQHIHILEANDNNDIDVHTNVDLVLSLLSWGFHYPVKTYVDKVHDLLSNDGIVILDVRKGTDGVDVLKNKFQHVEVIFETKKQYRVAVRK